MCSFHDLHVSFAIWTVNRSVGLADVRASLMLQESRLDPDVPLVRLLTQQVFHDETWTVPLSGVYLPARGRGIRTPRPRGQRDRKMDFLASTACHPWAERAESLVSSLFAHCRIVVLLIQSLGIQVLVS